MSINEIIVCTVKAYDILNVKNAFVNSVYCVTAYAIFTLVATLFCVQCIYTYICLIVELFNEIIVRLHSFWILQL